MAIHGTWDSHESAVTLTSEESTTNNCQMSGWVHFVIFTPYDCNQETFHESAEKC